MLTPFNQYPIVLPVDIDIVKVPITVDVDVETITVPELLIEEVVIDTILDEVLGP
jgi:hypothetical protein